jgi:DMSO/TMAO reductase YedYZ heme-binding membrane subunit
LNHEAADRRHLAGPIVAVTVVLCLSYTVLRYHIFGPVPWKDFPFFILNKGISLSALVLLSLNFGLGPLKKLGGRVPATWLDARKSLGMTAFLLVLVHVLMSFLLFKPAVYGKMFESDGSLTLFAGLSMLGGVLAFVVLWGYNLSFQTHLREDRKFIQFITSKRFLLVAMLFSAVHLFFMGYEGWLQPSGWPGGLPPISLVSFSIFVIAYGINLFGRK